VRKSQVVLEGTTLLLYWANWGKRRTSQWMQLVSWPSANHYIITCGATWKNTRRHQSHIKRYPRKKAGLYLTLQSENMKGKHHSKQHGKERVPKNNVGWIHLVQDVSPLATAFELSNKPLDYIKCWKCLACSWLLTSEGELCSM